MPYKTLTIVFFVLASVPSFLSWHVRHHRYILRRQTTLRVLRFRTSAWGICSAIRWDGVEQNSGNRARWSGRRKWINLSWTRANFNVDIVIDIARKFGVGDEKRFLSRCYVLCRRCKWIFFWLFPFTCIYVSP